MPARPGEVLVVPITKTRRSSAEDLREMLLLQGVRGRVFATDFYVEGAEKWGRVPGGWEHPEGRILNIDHHAPHRSMERMISSTNLAIERLGAGLPPDPKHDAVVVNHMDCDSVLAAGILSGRLQPDPAYGEAAIAADHTGVENRVADLLQGLDAHWSRSHRPMPSEDGLELFFESIARLESGRMLDAFVEEAVAERKTSRDRAARLVAEGRFEIAQGVFLTRLEVPTEGELFLPLLPDAVVVMTASPYQNREDRWQVKIRLGLAAPTGLSLHDLGIPAWDEAYGGRWNAGSNHRGGGTALSPEEYCGRLAKAVTDTLSARAPGSQGA